MEASEFLQIVESLHADARKRGLFFQSCSDEEIRGRLITVNGQTMTSFGSCSYLGLEFHPALISLVHEAVDRFGTQFASSRGYLSSPWYEEFESTMDRIFDAHVVTVQTTTLAHQAMFDVFLTEKDALVMDHHVHYSVQRASVLARAVGAHVEIVRHDELERAVDLVRKLAKKHKTVWFATDGVTSMYGDLAPVDIIQKLLDAAPNVRVYVDDAHGMSWAGKYGRGSFLSRMPQTDRMVIATSLSKAFAAGGSALVFKSKEEAERVRMCGGPMVFSGPLQPPLLGAALGSARLHLTDELVQLQAVLQERVRYCNKLLKDAEMPLLVDNDAPIRFIRLGLPRVASEVASRLAKDGYYANVSMFPSVPMKRGGLRLGITATHSKQDIEGLVAALSRRVPEVLKEEGMTREDLDALFSNSVVRTNGVQRKPASYVNMLLHDAAGRTTGAAPADWARTGLDCDPQTLTVQHMRTIRDVPRDVWDAALGSAGCCSWEAMAAEERIFRNQERPEHNWEFHYVLVRDPQGTLVCATFFTTGLQKDDFLMRAEVSKAVEQRRLTEPYFLTSRSVTMGSGLSEGNHLYVNRSGPWRAALQRAMEVGSKVYEETHADILVMRDLPGDDPEMDEHVRSLGLIKVPNMESHILDIGWREPQGLLASIENRKKRAQVREIMGNSQSYSVQVYGAGLGNAHLLPPEHVDQLHALYQNVARTKLRFNAFELPRNMLHQLLESPAWEFGVLHLKDESGRLVEDRAVAFWGAHRHAEHYAMLFCGLDYRYVKLHGAYRQCTYQAILRAAQVGARTMHMGMDAEVEKKRFGARAHSTCLYVQAREDYNAAILQQIVAEVGIGAQEKPPVVVSQPTPSPSRNGMINGNTGAH